MPERDHFELGALRIDPVDPDLRPKAKGATRKTTKWRKQFVRVPWIWTDRLKDAHHISTYRVALHLLYEHWRNGGRVIRLSNSTLKEEGIERREKWRGLRELERFGLIKIERRPRKAPLITVLADLRRGKS
jgi:hypothetical protein